jgi:protein TonB
LASTALSPEQDPSDRLGVALFLALVFHAAVILGVSFAPRERPREQANTLDIVLVQSRTDEIPEETDFLGQANQIGGGESEEVARPATPLPAPLRSQRAEIVAAARPSRPSAPLAIEQRVTAAPEPRPEDSAPRRPAARPLLSQTRTPTRHRVVSTPTPSPTPKSKPAPKPDPMVRPETPPKPPASRASERAPRPDAQPSPATPPQPTQTLDAATLVSRSLAMASLSAEIDQKLESYAKRPRHHWISASTREHAYASYMEAWRMKVERIGNLNYPDEARRKRLSGHLLLDVALNPDGSIHDIVLRRSSGHKVLDDAAVRIVKLASPYARFPQNIAQEVDVLHIQRTWRFSSTNRFLGD